MEVFVLLDRAFAQWRFSRAIVLLLVEVTERLGIPTNEFCSNWGSDVEDKPAVVIKWQRFLVFSQFLPSWTELLNIRINAIARFIFD